MNSNKKSNGLSIRQADQRRKVMEEKEEVSEHFHQKVHDFISAPPIASQPNPDGETSLGDVFDCLVWEDGTSVEMDDIIVSE